MLSFSTRLCAGALSVVVILASPSAEKRTTAGPSAVATPSPPIAEASGMSYNVQVYARDNSNQLSSIASTECAAVRRALEVPLANLADPSQAIDVVETALKTAFVGRVRQDPDTVRYKAVWCPEIQAFKIKCCVISVFEVMLDNAILVPVEIGARL